MHYIGEITIEQECGNLGHKIHIALTGPKGRLIVFPWMGGLVVKAPAYEWRVQGSSPG